MSAINQILPSCLSCSHEGAVWDLCATSQVDGSILVAWVGNLATKLALAATNCALSLPLGPVLMEEQWGTVGSETG